MVIQHNISALNAHRNFLNIQHKTTSLVNKLATGKHINKSADDAAGLGIAERMRYNIRGLSQSIKNSTDAVSLIQTADGGLKESQSILRRMLEIATESANGTFDNYHDRDAAELEYQNLQDSLNYLSSSTNYNNIKLLDGSLSQSKDSLYKQEQASDSYKYMSKFIKDMRFIINEAIMYKKENAIILDENGGLKFCIDSYGKENSEISLVIDDMSSSGLDIADTTVNSQLNARTSISKLQKAIDTVSSARGSIGSVQNSLEMSSQSLIAYQDNLVSSVSRITDLDMAKAAMDLAKNKILSEVSQSALAQANLNPKSVINLIEKSNIEPIKPKEKIPADTSEKPYVNEKPCNTERADTSRAIKRTLNDNACKPSESIKIKKPDTQNVRNFNASV